MIIMQIVDIVIKYHSCYSILFSKFIVEPPKLHIKLHLLSYATFQPYMSYITYIMQLHIFVCMYTCNNNNWSNHTFGREDTRGVWGGRNDGDAGLKIDSYLNNAVFIKMICGWLHGIISLLSPSSTLTKTNAPVFISWYNVWWWHSRIYEFSVLGFHNNAYKQETTQRSCNKIHFLLYHPLPN